MHIYMLAVENSNIFAFDLFSFSFVYPRVIIIGCYK
jgi:hypothetical protein